MSSQLTNPFSTKYWTPGAIPYRFEEECRLDRLIETAARLRLVQIVGPHGTGKTTLLESLEVHARRRGLAVVRATLSDRGRRLPDPFLQEMQGPDRTRTLFMVDGYEQLSLLGRLSLRRTCWKKTAGLILTCHRPARFVPVLHRTFPDPKLFRELVAILTEQESFPIDEETVNTIFRQSGGNFREAFFRLYDLIEDLPDRQDDPRLNRT